MMGALKLGLNSVFKSGILAKHLKIPRELGELSILNDRMKYMPPNNITKNVGKPTTCFDTVKKDNRSRDVHLSI